MDIELSAGGVNVRTESLASIIGGGIAFQAPPDEGLAPPAEAGCWAAARRVPSQTMVLSGELPVRPAPGQRPTERGPIDRAECRRRQVPA